METILLVEDDQATRLSLELLLANEGYGVTSAANGVEAFADLAVKGVDLIVTDWSMPHMDGVRLCKNLRADSVFRSLPIVMVSSDIAPDEDGETLWDAFFRKPFEIPDLLHMIRALLDERRFRVTALSIPSGSAPPAPREAYPASLFRAADAISCLKGDGAGDA